MNIDYGLCTESDADELARVLGDVFARHDPPAVAAGVTAAEFTAFVALWCPKAATEQLTIVARSAETGELVGAMLVEDSASGLPDGLDALAPAFDPIFDILGRLGAQYAEHQATQAGESAHLFLLGVAEQHGGRGIAQRLVAEALEHATRRGYRKAVTEATSRTSQHIFRKHGFVDRAWQAYADHRFEGRAVFESIAEHGGPILMDRPL